MIDVGKDVASPTVAAKSDRIPPYSEEAERGVLGSIFLDSSRVLDLCIERQIVPEAFYVPANRTIYSALIDMSGRGEAVDILTVSERLKSGGELEKIGGSLALDRLIDSTPTAAHAEYYIDIVRQKYLLRCIISCSREAEGECFNSEDSADQVLGRVEQWFLDITERQHGFVMPWTEAVKEAMQRIEQVFVTKKGVSGIPTGFTNLDCKLLGFKPTDLVILASRPSMGKTSLAMNIAENIALGKVSDHKPRSVGIFSLEMSLESLLMRMLCSHARVSAFKIEGGYVSAETHRKLMRAASALMKAPIYLDDTGGLDILELRARARRMKKKHDVQMIVVDYLQLLHAKDYARQGRQLETAAISGALKAMAKELRVPVLVLSQLSRAPESRDKIGGKPKLSDLRDSGAIEQDADVVCMLRRPCKYPDDEQFEDKSLSILDIVKHRNGPTGVAKFNFEEEYTRFEDRAQGVDDGEPINFGEDMDVT